MNNSSLILGRKLGKKFFQKMCARGIGGTFFSGNNKKMHKAGFLKLIKFGIEKKVSKLP